MRKATVGALASLAVLSTVFVNAPSASAEPNPPGCPKGNVCFYSDPGMTKLVRKSQGDINVTFRARAVFNNGNPHVGADHIYLNFTDAGRPGEMCLHHNPGPGTYKAKLPPQGEVTSAKWGGECP